MIVKCSILLYYVFIIFFNIDNDHLFTLMKVRNNFKSQNFIKVFMTEFGYQYLFLLLQALLMILSAILTKMMC